MAAPSTWRDQVNANANAISALGPLEPDLRADATLRCDCALPASPGTTGIITFNERVQIQRRNRARPTIVVNDHFTSDRDSRCRCPRHASNTLLIDSKLRFVPTSWW